MQATVLPGGARPLSSLASPPWRAGKGKVVTRPHHAMGSVGAWGSTVTAGARSGIWRPGAGAFEVSTNGQGSHFGYGGSYLGRQRGKKTPTTDGVTVSGGGMARGPYDEPPKEQDLWTRVKEPWDDVKDSSAQEEEKSGMGILENAKPHPPFSPPQFDDHDHHHDNSFVSHSAASLVNKASYQLVRINSSGTSEKLSMVRRELLRSTGLVPRDLRRLDPSLSMKSPPSLVVRDQVVLCNIGGVRAVISSDYALLFEPDSKSAKKFMAFLSTRLGPMWGGGSSPTSTLQSLDTGVLTSSEAAAFAAAPFELEAVEAALMVATARLDKLVLRLKARTDHLLRVLPGKRVTTEALEELRRMKQALVELESNAESVSDVLLELLDDREDMAEMCISARKEHKIRLSEVGEGDEGDEEALAEADEVLGGHLDDAEDLMEYYYQRCESVQSEAANLLADARDLEESIGLSLSNRRYEVNRLELMLSVASFVSALGAMVAGIFGMNLQSTLESSIVGFWGVTGAIVLGGILAFVLIMRWLNQRNIL